MEMTPPKWPDLWPDLVARLAHGQAGGGQNRRSKFVHTGILQPSTRHRRALFISAKTPTPRFLGSRSISTRQSKQGRQLGTIMSSLAHLQAFNTRQWRATVSTTSLSLSNSSPCQKGAPSVPQLPGLRRCGSYTSAPCHHRASTKDGPSHHSLLTFTLPGAYTQSSTISICAGVVNHIPLSSASSPT